MGKMRGQCFLLLLETNILRKRIELMCKKEVEKH